MVEDLLDALQHVTEIDLSWMGLAECSGRPNLFFSPPFERPGARMARESAAKAVCLQCEALDPCKAYGRDNHEYGVWGGENEEERVSAGFRLNAPVGIRRRRCA